MVVAACGDKATPTPSGEPAASDAPASAVTGTGPGGITLLAYDGVFDPAAAGTQELALVKEARDSAGMPALLGPNGQATFDALDAITAAFAQDVRKDAAMIVDTGAIPATSRADPQAGLIASIGGSLPEGAPTADDIDISFYADTGFTANIIMGMFTGLVERAAESNGGTLPNQKDFDETSADGTRQQGTVSTTMTVQTGGGKVHAEITMSAEDNISNAGNYVAHYTSSSTGVFDVDACPDADGNAKGTYSFSTKHELNDVSGAANVQSGAGRSADAPFTLVDGDDAHLVQIEAALNLTADARGPGSAGGPGPTGPFDWSASQGMQLVMPAHGSTSGTGAPATVTGTGAAGVSAGMNFSASMAQLFLGEVGKEAEKFWRSGKCIKLEPDPDSKDVQPEEEIDLTVRAKGAFDNQEIEKPITAKFDGKESLSPADQPQDEPATFHFKAGKEQGDKGTIDLKQTSVRGIGMLKVVYTVAVIPLRVEITTRTKANAGLAKYDTKIQLKPTDLLPAGDGTYQAKGASVSWTTTLTAPKCTTKTYSGTFTTDMTARIDPDDENRALLKAVFIPGVLHPETIHCGKNFSFTGSTDLGVWTALLAEQGVTIDGSLTIHPSEPLGSATMTIKITKPTGR